MATLKWPGSQYTETITSGTTYLGLDRHVDGVGVSITPTAGSYFLLVTADAPSAIEAETAKWHDVLGNGTDAQTTARAVDLDGGNWTALAIARVSGTIRASVKIARRS